MSQSGRIVAVVHASRDGQLSVSLSKTWLLWPDWQIESGKGPYVCVTLLMLLQSVSYARFLMQNSCRIEIHEREEIHRQVLYEAQNMH